MDYEVLAFVGRFQPFHKGHKAVVDAALGRAKQVAIVIGSHDQPRNSRNPFTTSERIEMITSLYPDEVKAGKIHFVPQVDHAYNLDRWIAGVTTGVEAVVTQGGWTDTPPRIGLIGHSKDHTSFYLKSFPRWGSVEVDNVDGIDATAVRVALFSGYRASVDEAIVPQTVAAWLDRWIKKDQTAYYQVVAEMDFLTRYRKQFESLPYPPIFQTTDAVVVSSGNVLLVKRGAQPGQGLWALPGGFLNAHELIEDGCIRELREETKIGIPDPVLRGSIVNRRTFDDPNRSLRGRTITTAFLIRLADRKELPKIKGSDDAVKAQWVPLSNLRRSMMYEDHFDMVEALVGI